MKKLLSILGSLCVGVSLTAHAQQKTYTLEFTDNPPFTLTENGQNKGVAIGAVSKLFEKAGIKYQYRNVPLARAMADAKSQENTCVFPVQRSQDMEAEYQWVGPIFITSSGLFMRQDATAQFLTLSDAKKMKIGALRGSGDAEYLKRHGFSVEEANTQEQNVEKLTTKRFDIWATDELSAKYFIAKSGSKEKMPKDVFTFRRTLSSLACNVKMPKADVAKLQEILDGMLKDGTIQKLTTAAP